jgi:hypothetical protein
MANTLTNIAPVLYSAAQQIPRELVGFLGAIDLNFDDKGVAKGDTVKVPVVGTRSGNDYTPAMTTTAGTDTTPTTATFTMSKSRYAHFNMTGEDERSLQNGGDNAKEFVRQSTQQCIRTLCNEMEADIADEAHKNSSRAVGTAGTAPFASDVKPVATTLQILLDNGIADTSRMSLIINTAAGTNLRNNVTINGNTPDSKAGGMLDTGVLARIHGVSIRESGQVKYHTAGTGSGYQANSASLTVGTTTIAADTGSNTIIAGDVVRFAAAGAYYVVNTALSAGSFVIGAPGLTAAVADNDAIALSAAHYANMMVHRNCIVGAVRPPIMVPNANMEELPVTDPVSGLTFLMVRIVGDGMVTYRVQMVWGFKAVQSHGIATLMG